jgi:O-antigen ligase
VAQGGEPIEGQLALASAGHGGWDVRKQRVILTRDLLALRVRSLWGFFRSEGLAFWAMCGYLVVEYVRPQQLIRAIYGAPLGEIVLVAALLAHVGSGRRLAMKGLGSWLLLLFSAVIVLSSLTAYRPGIAIGQWRLWFSWVVIFFLIINVVNTERRFVFFTLAWMICNYYMSQGGAKQFAFRGFRFASWGVTGAPGYFANAGEFGIEMCMFLVISWHYYLAARPYLNKWRKLFMLGMPATAILSVVGSSSRGALLGLAVLGAWELLRGKRPLRTTIGVAGLATAVWLVMPQQFKERFSGAGEDYTSVQRLVYWKAGLDMVAKYPVLGVGYANWTPYYADHYADPGASAWSLEGRVQLSHNIFIECMAELGYAGLGAFALLILGTLRINYQTRKFARAGPAPPNDFVILMAYSFDGAMISYLVCGFFVTVLYYPFFWVNLALTVALGAIARRTYHTRRAGIPLRPNVGPSAAQPVGPMRLR